jgi:predicted ATPase
LAARLVADHLAIPIGQRYPVLELTPDQKKAKTLKVMLNQLEGLAHRQPVLMIVEDAHWFDPTSLEWFDLVVDRVDRLPILLVITFRPEFVRRWAGRSIHCRPARASSLWIKGSREVRVCQ